MVWPPGGVPEGAQQSVSQGKVVIPPYCSPAIMHASQAGQESDSASTYQLPLCSHSSTGMFRLSAKVADSPASYTSTSPTVPGLW